MVATWLPGDTRQRIQDLIKDNNITQAELAGSIGLSESAFSRYLKGQTEMLGDGYIIKIAKRFNVSTDFLLGETDIPDRKNYDIEELGLSAESARLLYTGKVDSNMLNLLLEHPRFPQLLALLSRYQNEIVKSGIIAMNQQLSFLNSLLLEHAEHVPEDAEAARQAAHDINAMRSPAINADITAIQNLIMQIANDIKAQGEKAITGSDAITKEIFGQIKTELSKGEDSMDLRKITPEDLTAAVIQSLSTTGISDETLSEFASVFQKILNEMQARAYDN